MTTPKHEQDTPPSKYYCDETANQAWTLDATKCGEFLLAPPWLGNIVRIISLSHGGGSTVVRLRLVNFYCNHHTFRSRRFQRGGSLWYSPLASRAVVLPPPLSLAYRPA